MLDASNVYIGMCWGCYTSIGNVLAVIFEELELGDRSCEGRGDGSESDSTPLVFRG